MNRYQIINKTERYIICYYSASSEQEALDKMAKESGYANYAECLEQDEEGDTIEVRLVSTGE